MRIAITLLILLLSSTNSFASIQCYEEASIPAHEFVFHNMKGIHTVTGIAIDGNSCTKHVFLDGEAIFEQRMYTTLRKLYETYATAYDNYVKEPSPTNKEALIRIMTYLRPTPRSFSLWNALFNSEEGAPMPWGMNMAINILKFLQPNNSLYNKLNTSNEVPKLAMDRTWPALFMIMGGEIYPTEEWSSYTLGVDAIQQIMLLRFPNYLIETKKENKAKFIKIR